MVGENLGSPRRGVAKESKTPLAVILTKHFVYIHIPKTGGTFVRKIMREHAPESWEMTEQDHTLVENTPETHADLPKFGCVRNPFPWYVSWYVYHKQHPFKFFNEVSENNTLGFKESLINAMHHEQVRNAGDRLGFFTMVMQNFLGPEARHADVIRCESLRTELFEWLDNHVEVPQSMAAAIQEEPKVNISVRDHYSKFYDDELIELILDRDRHIFQRTGYQFEAEVPSK